MTDQDIELSIELPAETTLAIKRAAEVRGMSVSEFVNIALRKSLIDAGYLDDDEPRGPSAS
jgi:uncharacterized protein (DUF1778 family)